MCFTCDKEGAKEREKRDSICYIFALFWHFFCAMIKIILQKPGGAMKQNKKFIAIF